jgi:hypothetical protein
LITKDRTAGRMAFESNFNSGGLMCHGIVDQPEGKQNEVMESAVVWR